MKNGDALFVNSSIDNLLRGASSQALVAANLMYGLDEGLGVPIISSVP
jgi:N-acetyl-gamma-glutamyl-phosphate reductase